MITRTPVEHPSGKQILEAIRQLGDAVCEAVAVAGERGAPGGVIYLALNSFGLSLDAYEKLMDALIGAGRIEKRGELYFLK